MKKEDVMTNSPSAFKEAHQRKVLALLEEAVKAAKKLDKDRAFLVSTTGQGRTVTLSNLGLYEEGEETRMRREVEWWGGDMACSISYVEDKAQPFSRIVGPSLELVQRARITESSLKSILSQIEPPSQSR